MGLWWECGDRVCLGQGGSCLGARGRPPRAPGRAHSPLTMLEMVAAETRDPITPPTPAARDLQLPTAARPTHPHPPTNPQTNCIPLSHLCGRFLELALPLALVIHEAQHGKGEQGDEEGGQQVDVALEDQRASAVQDARFGRIEDADKDGAERDRDGDAGGGAVPDWGPKGFEECWKGSGEGKEGGWGVWGVRGRAERVSRRNAAARKRVPAPACPHPGVASDSA